MRPIRRVPYRIPAFGLLVLLAVFAMSACDSVNVGKDADSDLASQDLSAMADALAADLELDDAGKAGLRATFARQERYQREPGFLWRLAKDLHQTLSPEQRERLFRFLERRQDVAEHVRDRMSERFQPGDFRLPILRFLRSLDLTDDQRTAIEAIRDEYAPRVRELAGAWREAKDDEARQDVREQMQALRQQMHDEITAVLTEEQRAKLQDALEDVRDRREDRRDRREDRRDRREDWRENREEAREVMIEVLGLTPQQVESLESLQERHQEQVRELYERLRAGALDRQHFREALEELRQAATAERANILTVEQTEITKIHRALSMRLAVRRLNADGGRWGRMGPR